MTHYFYLIIVKLSLSINWPLSRLFLSFLSFLLLPVIVFSQDNKTVVFKKNIFIEKHSGTIILYDDTTTEFKQFSKEELDLYYSREVDSMKADTMRVFKENWSSTNLFPYNNSNLSYLKDSILFDFSNANFYCSLTGSLFSGFGFRWGRQHMGLDTDLDIGDTIRAAFDGKVRYSDFNTGGFGNLIIIRHYNGLETYYAHQTTLFVKSGEFVRAGDPIGTGGQTGRATGPHLHFEIRYKDNAFDPLNIIDLKNRCLKLDTFYLTKEHFKWKKELSKTKYHKIKQGETLSHLANKYHTSVKRILKLNKNLRINSILQIGQKIRVK